MKYMLDTNTCIYIIKRKPQDVLEKFQTIAPFDISISSITVAELEYGAAKSQFPDRNCAALNQFLIPIEIIQFDEQAATIYGNIRATLERFRQNYRCNGFTHSGSCPESKPNLSHQRI